MAFKLQLLGSFESMVNSHAIQFRTDKIRALLAYLILESSMPQPKMLVASLLWGNSNDRIARTNLRVSIYRLRQAIDKQSQSSVSQKLFKSNRQTIQLNINDPFLPVWCDVLHFQQLVTLCEAHDHQDIRFCSVCLARLEQTAVLYRGEFLHGSQIDDSEIFVEWLLLRREQLHQQAVKVLGILVEGHLGQSQFAKVQQYAHQLLALEPWHENIYRYLMTALMLSGQRDAAMAQYEVCRQILRQEMGLEPGVETAVLYQKIVANDHLDVPSIQRMHSHLTGPATNDWQQPKHNLSSMLTPFFGREAELQQLTRLLLSPDSRFVTLVGEGGVGKTRLALEGARRVLNGFADGVWLVPLDRLSAAANRDDTQDVLAVAVSLALGLSLDSLASPKTQLINFLKSRHLLLIMDNFEHILEGAELVYDLLTRTAAVSVLCSSRIPLGFVAETILPLEPLPLPILSEVNLPESGLAELELAHFASLQLFTDRARHLTGKFELNVGNQIEVATVCHLVDGNPLGIELAAASLRQRTLPETIVAIQESMDIVAARFGDIPPRHRSMRAVFEHSWRLLNADEQSLLAQLSLFRSGFVLTAVQAIMGGNASTVAMLKNHSLLIYGDGRYAMHGLLRQFAAEKLAQQLPQTDVSLAYGRYYMNFLAQREADLAGAAPQIPAAEITAELNNIRHAWEMTCDNQNAALLLSGLNAFAAYLQMRGRYGEGERLFRKTAMRLEQAGDVAETAVLLTRLKHYQLAALDRLSRYEESMASAKDTLPKPDRLKNITQVNR